MEYKATSIINIGGLVSLAGGFIAGIAFLVLPYISLGFLGNYTALQVVQLGSELHVSDTGLLWLELLVALVVLILAIVAWKPSAIAKRLALTNIVLSSITIVLFFIMYSLQSQQKILGIPLTTFYASGFWLYIVGIVIALIGSIIQYNTVRKQIAVSPFLSYGQPQNPPYPGSGPNYQVPQNPSYPNDVNTPPVPPYTMPTPQNPSNPGSSEAARSDYPYGDGR